LWPCGYVIFPEGGIVTITAVESSLTCEERGHALHSVSIGVLGRRIPGPTVLLSVLADSVLVAVRHQ
jgi:hypothetical protein